MTLREEFVFSIGGRKLYTIRDFDYFDDILAAEDQRFWGNVIVCIQRIKKYEKEPEIKPIANLPLKDVIRKFG